MGTFHRKPQRHYYTVPDVFSDYESIIRECQDKMRSVDQSMTDLANSVDIMYEAVNGFEDHRKELTLQDSVADPEGERYKHISPQLVHFIKSTVLPNKDKASDSVCEFLHFVHRSIGQFIEKPADYSLELKLDSYQKSGLYPEEIVQHFRQNARLNEENKTPSAYNDYLIEKENIHILEVGALTKKNEIIQSNLDILETKNKEAEETIIQLKAEVENHNRKASELREKERNMQLLESTNANVQTKLQQLMSQCEDSTLENEILNNSVKERSETIKSLEDNILAKDTEIKRQLGEIRELQSKHYEHEEEKIKSKKLTDDLKRQVETMRNNVLKTETLESRYKDLEKEKKKCKKELELKEHQNTELTRKNEKFKQEAESTSKTIDLLEKQNQSLKEENNRINQELERLKRKKLIQVQLYYPRGGDLICKIEKELVSLLKKEMESEDKYEVEFLKCLNTSDVQTDKSLLLLCFSASRIGTYAANTIQGIHLTSKMSLLIFHHKDEHALPSQASGQILTGQEYKMLGGIHDFAFLSGKGLYTCSMNNKSLANTIAFIKTEGGSV